MDITDEETDEALVAAFGAMADGIEKKTDERIRAAVLAEREAMRAVAHQVAADLGCRDRAYADELIDAAIRARK
jgi:hypothetical protein